MKKEKTIIRSLRRPKRLVYLVLRNKKLVDLQDPLDLTPQSKWWRGQPNSSTCCSITRSGILLGISLMLTSSRLNEIGREGLLKVDKIFQQVSMVVRSEMMLGLCTDFQRITSSRLSNFLLVFLQEKVAIRHIKVFSCGTLQKNKLKELCFIIAKKSKVNFQYLTAKETMY